MLYYFHKVKITIETKKKKRFVSAWRWCCDGLNVSKVVCKVCAWDFSLDDALWLGRPVEVDSEQVKTLIKNN